MGLFSSKKKTTPPTAAPATARKGRKATAAPPPPAQPTRNSRNSRTAPPPARKASPTPAATTSRNPTSPPADLHRRIAEQVCAQHQADGLRPHEVVLKANGEVWIDRRAKDPRAVPFVIGTWK